ncbi:cytochrome c biogenesis factor-like protein [Sphingomonas sp. CBMAI 2297]|uniref:tetratricopeptide repeat protein n=1 Tax=Sphingomonas sp. CBMAI 2297 TaxID=2991720 RepID=UPI002457FC6C|nr:tetratricopeptide repeat protein [Sphingomonas sp. CBMAI 2297]MDH4743264.1 cytochrome c biogenesis factor-like protein [Sphingomonas sp. CBMAI 2297]
MGWGMLATVAVVAVLALALLRYPRRLWTVPATAIMLGAAGYAWQGSPGLPGHPVAPGGQRVEVDQGLIDLRDAMFGKYGTYAWSYGNLADAMLRQGDRERAVKVWQGAVRQVPEDVALWTGFGSALAEYDGNQISPAAQFAFDKAFALAPEHPGPPFFYGLALVRANRFAEAEPWWEKAVALTPAKASYRQALMARLLMLEAFLQEQARREGRPMPGPAR